MKNDQLKEKFRVWLDNILLINFFLVIFFALFFFFALIMQINGNNVFINFFQSIWNPFIVPLITILITSALISGITSWLKQKLRSQEEDI